MTDLPAAQAVRFELRLDDDELAEEIEQWLATSDAAGMSRREEFGILPLLPIVIGALMGLSGLASLVMWIRSKTRCQVVIDARGETLQKEIDCRIRDGRIVVVTKDNVKVQLLEVPDVFDMQKVLTAALSAGAGAVKSVAEAAGATVKV